MSEAIWQRARKVWDRRAWGGIPDDHRPSSRSADAPSPGPIHVTVVAVLGATGVFGRRIAERLLRIPGVQVALIARSETSLRELADRLASADRITPHALDLDTPDAESELSTIAPAIVVDTVGPFQSRDWRWQRWAIAGGVHWIDLADAPEYVAAVGELDAEASAAGVLICSGASSVPGLSSAVIAQHLARFESLDEVEIGIAPGNRTERGLATIRSILSTVGKPIPGFVDGHPQDVIGWSGLTRHRYPEPVGPRWLARCAVPDPLVLPAAFPSVREFDFRAGMELKRMHWGLWLAHFAVRLGLMRSMAPYAERLKAISEWWLDAGSDAGAMHVRMSGQGRNGAPLAIEWTLIAERGHGPYVPGACSVAIVRGLVEGRLARRGAMACVGVVMVEAVMAELEGLTISTSTSVV